MTMMEIILLLIGIVAFVASFRIPVSKEEKIAGQFPASEEEIQKLVQIQVDEAASKISNSVDETVNEAVERAEQSMDKLTNEKMMAVSEYADTVLTDIHKNHEEVVFLYDMLNDKQMNLKNTVREVEQTAKTVSKTAKEAKKTVREVVETVESVQESNKNALADGKENLQDRKASGEEMNEKETDILQDSFDVGAQADSLREKKNRTRAGKKKTEEGQVDSKAAKRTLQIPELVTTDSVENDETERNKNEEILAMHKAGKSNTVIARELGLGVGEVKLVIDLFKGI